MKNQILGLTFGHLAHMWASKLFWMSFIPIISKTLLQATILCNLKKNLWTKLEKVTKKKKRKKEKKIWAQFCDQKGKLKLMNQTLKNGKNRNFGPDFGLFGPNLGPPIFFSGILHLLDVRHCRKLSSNAISRKTYDPNTRKWRKTSLRAWRRSTGSKFGPSFIFF